MINRLRHLSIASLKKFGKRTPDRSETRRVGREHFIPVRPAELVELLAESDQLTSCERDAFLRLCGHLQTTFHVESHRQLRQLQNTYACVNPDADTEPLSQPTEEQRDIAVGRVFEDFVELLRRANFRQLTGTEIRAAVGNASALGMRLNVDLDQFERLAVFARGEVAITYRKNEFRKLWFRPVEHDIPMFQRLVVLFRFKSEPEGEREDEVRAAYIRLFKNVPQQDIDMLLPGGEVRMSLMDRGKILLPTVSGIGLATFKLSLLFVAGIYGLLKILGLVGSAIGSGWKSVNGYWKTKNRYELSLTKHLYYQNLDNNAGVLLRLAEEAERQELRETILGYFMLFAGRKEMTAERLDADTESMLSSLGMEVDFEVRDALNKLARLRLCRKSHRGRWKAVPLDEAIKSVMANNLHQAMVVRNRGPLPTSS